MRRVSFQPWPFGIVAFTFIGLSALGFIRYLPRKASADEAVAGVAPQRTREVPILDALFQTSIRGLYIVGEAAGTASINLAMRSGRQVIDCITAELHGLNPPVQTDVHDVAIVGCGPAGLGATAAAKAAGLKYVTIEKMTPATTLRSYPRAKFVQATPIDIAEYGSFFLEGDNSREQLLAEWDKIIAQLQLVINEREEVVDVVRERDNFTVKTMRGNAYVARSVVLAIGVRGTRHLNLAGEEPDRVHYKLIEPLEFQNKKILVVGGGNAGAEVAQALAAPQLHNIVSYSFRSHTLNNVTRENAEKIIELQQSNTLAIFAASALTEIKPGKAVLEPMKGGSDGGASGSSDVNTRVELDNDIIFAMLGADLPTAFLKKIGVSMGKKGMGGIV